MYLWKIEMRSVLKKGYAFAQLPVYNGWSLYGAEDYVRVEDVEGLEDRLIEYDDSKHAYYPYNANRDKELFEKLLNG